MDLSLLFCGFVFGVIGIWMFRQGKKNAHLPFMAIGIILMVYTYFISNVWIAWITGIVLCVASYLIRK